MSNTMVDMPKVCQMLDAGWTVEVFKNALGSYTAVGTHYNEWVHTKAETTLRNRILNDPNADESITYEVAKLLSRMEADDFTPEQALTRLAYKVHGEII